MMKPRFPPGSDRHGQLVERDGHPPVHRRLNGQLEMACRRFWTKACPAVTTLALWSCLKPYIGRSRDFSRPWSASTRLLAYRSLRCQDAGSSSSSTIG